MSNFGDIRSACHASDASVALRELLPAYDDCMVPIDQVAAYVVRAVGQLPPTSWRAYNNSVYKVCQSAHDALLHGLPCLEAVCHIGGVSLRVGYWDEQDWLTMQLRSAYIEAHRALIERDWVNTPDVEQLTMMFSRILDVAKNGESRQLSAMCEALRGRFCPAPKMHIILAMIRLHRLAPFRRRLEGRVVIGGPMARDIITRLDKALLAAHPGEGQKLSITFK